jgi:hypothetical protein
MLQLSHINSQGQMVFWLEDERTGRGEIAWHEEVAGVVYTSSFKAGYEIFKQFESNPAL